ncbi:MAG: GNAT family N-acetyltransferase [Bdellovibrionaceae bacterium]|nr:GNAT family N-acetyltransferase [Bdellovibrio sp.]
MKIIKVEDPQEKSKICEKILRSLPLWFGIESAILDYIQDVQRMETWVAFESEAIGFISLNKHNKYTAEIHVVGLLPEYHRQRVGSDLVKVAEKSLRSQDFKYLTVKTLSEARADENYEKTRKFYLKSGFVPIEEFKTLWGEHNPCLMLIKDLGLTANHTAEESINKIHNF